VDRAQVRSACRAPTRRWPKNIRGADHASRPAHLRIRAAHLAVDIRPEIEQRASSFTNSSRSGPCPGRPRDQGSGGDRVGVSASILSFGLRSGPRSPHPERAAGRVTSRGGCSEPGQPARPVDNDAFASVRRTWRATAHFGGSTPEPLTTNPSHIKPLAKDAARERAPSQRSFAPPDHATPEEALSEGANDHEGCVAGVDCRRSRHISQQCSGNVPARSQQGAGAVPARGPRTGLAPSQHGPSTGLAPSRHGCRHWAGAVPARVPHRAGTERQQLSRHNVPPSRVVPSKHG
jgi:hypothetical protein